MTFPADLEEAYDYDFALSAYDNESGYFDGYSNIDSTSIASPALYPDEDFFLSSGQRDHPGAAFGTHAGYDARHYYHNYDNTGGLSRRQGVRPMNRAQNSAPWNAMPATGHSPPKSGTSRHGPAQMLKTNSRASTEYTVESAMSLDSHDSSLPRTITTGSYHRHRNSPSFSSQEPPQSSSLSSTPPDDISRYCTHPDCLDPNTGVPIRHFSRKADVDRHHRSTHEPTHRDCPKKNCSRKGKAGFTRDDHLMEHLRSYHKENIPRRERPGGGSRERQGDNGRDAHAGGERRR